MSESVSLPTQFQSFIHLSRYSRWLPEQGRRESWGETVARYFDFFETHLKENTKFTLSKTLRAELESAILNLEVMPSMRCLMTAGEALAKSNIAGYNCAYTTVNRVRAFDEILFVLMNGTGVGYSVEQQYVERLPTIAEEFSQSSTTIIVEDSKAGWAKAYKELVSLLIGGQIPKWDLTKLRPAGARLKTFGGRASGPGPLDELFRFTSESFRRAAGRKLTSIECHDIVCKIAEVVVVGGVRRSALISLSNLADEKMRDAKTGAWWNENPQRALANNSIAYKSKPDIGIFMEEWISLYKSKSGERGIFNREAARKTVEKLGDRRDPNHEWGCNPCSEILLRDREFCNLSEVVVRADDTEESLKRKIRIATILGTFQSSLTHFPYLSSEWKRNCEEEALLGVSLTGILDNPMMSEVCEDTETLLARLRESAVAVNRDFARRLGINPAAAITCVKPSGTISQLVDSASGIHARHSEYYIRTVRADRKDPLCQLMIDKGFPHEPDVTKPDSVEVFSFPMQAVGSVTRRDMTALQHLELWLQYQRHWSEHKPSITVSIRDHEWLEVGAWVYKNFDEISGISFLPYSDHTYRQAPYTECSKEEYEALQLRIPKGVDWSDLKNYEKTDQTSGTQELACSAGSCELVDLVKS
jgi:ribonucleoside-triphosphate reductase (thioredoxin)